MKITYDFFESEQKQDAANLKVKIDQIESQLRKIVKKHNKKKRSYEKIEEKYDAFKEKTTVL